MANDARTADHQRMSKPATMTRADRLVTEQQTGKQRAEQRAEQRATNEQTHERP